MNTRRWLSAAMLACAVLVFAAGSVAAQGNTLQLFLSKTWGFSLGSQIQGQFALGVSGPADMTSVTFEIDGQEMATLTQAPFKYSFSTDNYAVGQHQLTATARTASGQVLKSNSIGAEIVTAAGGWQSTTRIMGPLFGIILLLVVVTIVVQVVPLGSRRRYEPGAVRNYGISGGTICRKCGRPFALAFLSPNLITGKLVRCPYCGKWSIARQASLDALRAAERAELQGATPQVQAVSPEEALRRQIEESRLSR